MRKLKFLIMAIMLLNISGFAGYQSNPDSEQNLLIDMFEKAKKHDIHALKEFEARITKNHKLYRTYLLALYIASPSQYEEIFVSEFPTDYDGIMYEYYERVESAKLAPSFLYSFKAIGSMAKDGNAKAIQKVISGFGGTDGVVSELYCETITVLLANQTQKTLKALSGIDKEKRKKIYLCLRFANKQELNQITASIDRANNISPDMREVVTELVRVIAAL